MAVDKFEKGKKYKFVGPEDYNFCWNIDMNPWKDGMPRECLNILSDNQNTTYGRLQECIFSEVPSNWSYVDAHRKHFVEVRPECAGDTPLTQQELKNRVLGDL
jgi:hypothetical protein